MRSKPQRVTIITITTAAFLIGLWLGHLGIKSGAQLLAASLLGLTLALPRRTRLLGLMMIALALGVIRTARSDLAYSNITNQYGHKVTLVGQVSDDPAISDKGYTKFTVGNLSQNGHTLAGSLDVITTNSHLQRGYKVSLTGKLGPTIGSRQGSMFATVVVISSQQDWLELWRQRFIAGIRNALPPPLSDFALGLLIGARSLLPKDLQTQLTLVGLSHLVAVSGYNLTILVTAIDRPLRRLSKYLATAGSLWLILGFMLVSGFSASVVRAAVVAGLALITRHYGRKPHPLTLIALAATATAFYRPEYLWADVGWQLSFLAFFGIMVLAPAIQARFRPNWLTAIVTESLAAQILTLPLIAIVFNQLSLIAPLANLIILPLVPLAMLCAFVAGLAGMLAPAIAGWLSWPAAWLLNAMLEIINRFASLKWASVAIGWPVAAGIAWYTCVIVTVVLLVRRHNPSRTTSANQPSPELAVNIV